MNAIFIICFIQNGNRILLKKRNKSPFKGYWNPPTAKVRRTESPIKTCAREVKKETGLLLEDLNFRGEFEVIDCEKQKHKILVFHSQLYDEKKNMLEDGEVEWVCIDHNLYKSALVSNTFIYILPYVIEFKKELSGKLIYNNNGLEICEIVI